MPTDEETSEVVEYTAAHLSELQDRRVRLLLAQDDAARMLRDIRREMGVRQREINHLGDLIDELQDELVEVRMP
jgi:hypothetical protein